ncbi:MAG: hypothetical protein JHC38_04255 [Thiotrichales bacterium]|jgi:hypothetical protein|nr:hypothetical protein [Thiotrichales bacterium]
MAQRAAISGSDNKIREQTTNMDVCKHYKLGLSATIMGAGIPVNSRAIGWPNIL